MKNAENIDFNNAKRQVMMKMGGEFDYDQFIDEINDIVQDATNIWKDYET